MNLRVRALRRAYKAAWFVRKGVRFLPFPHLNGGMVALWCDDRALFVRNSYNDYYGFPGGRLGMSEGFQAAAVRELAEETGIRLAEDETEFAFGRDLRFGWRKDRVEIFASFTTGALPTVTLDPVEIAEFHWWTIEEAMAQPLYRPVRAYLVNLSQKPAALP